MLTYELPERLIAQRPCEPRDRARLLVLDRATGEISHHIFRDLPQFLRPGDCLVLNDTKVLTARVYGKREETGGKVELLVLRSEGEATYWCLGKPGKNLRPGSRLFFNGARHHLEAEVISANGAERLVRFQGSDPFKIGEVPLPPYIRRAVQPEDSQWYQTVYARNPGAVAAPTAGLHFTEDLLERIKAQGVRLAFVTLHVGWGTFKPVGGEELREGKLHPEWFRILPETMQTIAEAKAKGGRVIAVGTTVVRALETAHSVERMAYRRAAYSIQRAAYRKHLSAERYPLNATEGTTELFIRPPFRFKMVDAMITNFHLPGTSLLYLVAAFAGTEQILAAYEEAIRMGYRFYSYGDAMLVSDTAPTFKKSHRCLTP